LTVRPQYRYLCISERHVCRVWKYSIHLRTRICMHYNLPGWSNDEEAAYLELAGPKGPRRIVDETAGEVTFAEQLVRVENINRKNNSPCTPQIM